MSCLLKSYSFIIHVEVLSFVLICRIYRVTLSLATPGLIVLGFECMAIDDSLQIIEFSWARRPLFVRLELPCWGITSPEFGPWCRATAKLLTLCLRVFRDAIDGEAIPSSMLKSPFIEYEMRKTFSIACPKYMLFCFCELDPYGLGSSDSLAW